MKEKIHGPKIKIEDEVFYWTIYYKAILMQGLGLLQGYPNARALKVCGFSRA